MKFPLFECCRWKAITKIVIFICLNLKEIMACPFSSYEESLLPVDRAQEEYEINYSDEASFTSLKLGFWSFFIPQLRNFDLENKIYQLGIPNTSPILLYQKGQQLILIETDLQSIVIGFVWFDETRQKIGHKYIFQNTELFFEFPLDNYEGSWIFTLISFEEQTLTVEMTGSEKQQFPQLNIDKQIFIKLAGGAVQIYNYFSNQVYELGQFRGRISKLISFQSEELFQLSFTQLSNYCAIPPQSVGEQTIFLIKGLKKFNGDIMLMNQIQHFGSRFYVSFWIKYDISSFVGFMSQTVILITTQKNYVYEEQSVFTLLKFLIAFNIESKTFLIAKNTIHHIYPTLEDSVNDFSPLEFSISTSYEDLYNCFANWHFIRFEYGIKTEPYTTIFELILFDFNQYVISTNQGKLLTNSLFYISIGGSDYIRNLLFGSFYDLKFQYNYDYNKPQNIANCYFTCQTCNGPYENNCTSCYLKSNRVLVNDLYQCQCAIGYFEIGELICKKLSDYFTSLVIDEKNLLNQNYNKCQIGWYHLPQLSNQNICLKCPQQQALNFMCFDCILNPDSWYKQPICTLDLTSQNLTNNVPFSYTKRKEKDFDVYFITNEGSLLLKPELQAFCQDKTNSECFQSNITHLNIKPYVICKPNYYYANEQCHFINPLCLKAKNFGECEEQIDNVYYFDGQYFLCPIQCQKCQFEKQMLQVQCLSCRGDLVLYNGQCQQCGQFCKRCQQYYDQILQYSYLKCYKCIDDMKYYLSFDGINCKKNLIKKCNYVFEVDKNDWTKNTLDLYFTPRNDEENIIVHCGRCDSSLYILNRQVCLRGWLDNYLYLYALDLCDDEITFELSFNILKNFQNKIFGFDNGEKNYGQNETSSLCTTKQFILYSNSYNEAIQFNEGCEQFNENCKICLQGRTNDTFVCLECQDGYYVEKVSEKCQKCPFQQHCEKCIQQNKLFQDEWKKEIRMSYKIFIEGEQQEHLFIQYGQSQIIDDYEIACTGCIIGYDLVQNGCIKSCPDSCLECQIQNGENICIKCKEKLMGRPMTILKNECVECSLNCLLCIERTPESLQAINPLFSNSQYESNSLPCIKSLQDKNYYFDDELQIFVDCQKYSNCQNSISIELNLICSKEQYLQQTSSFKNQNEQLQFFQKNIFIDDLVSDSSFKEFENDYFYYISNQQQIKMINISITSFQRQSCQIIENGKIQQKFSQNIFTAIYVGISLNFIYPTEFVLSNSLIISNFETIFISGLTLFVAESEIQKKLIFTSIFQLSILLNNINCLSKNDKFNNLQLQMINVKELEIINFEVFQMDFADQDYFFNIMNDQGDLKLKIINFVLCESTFKNSNLFVINLRNNVKVRIEKFLINSTFENSSLLTLQGEPSIGTIQIMNSNFTIQLNNTQYFINTEASKLLEINNVSFYSSIIQNSTLWLLNNDAKLTSISFIQNTFKESFIGFKNSEANYNQNYSFNNYLIVDNTYHPNIFLTKVSTIQGQLVNVSFSSLIIRANYIIRTIQDFNSKLKTAALFYLQVENLIIQHLTIERGYGLPDFSIVNANYIQIQSVAIFQAEKFKFFGIHQHLHCQLQFVQSTNYKESFRIYASFNIFISNITIDWSYTYDSPIILIKSENILFDQRQEIIRIQDLKARNNLLLLTKADSPASLIFIQSMQEQQLSLINSEFSNNIMVQYFQDQNFQSALILFLDCYKGKLVIQNSEFKGNILFNSSDSLNYINVNEITIDNSTFTSNNIFNFTTIQPYLLWKQNDEVQYYLEDLQNSFQIYSTTGNGLIIAERITLSNSQITESQGSNGGAFRLSSQKQGRIELTNVNFSGLKNLFKNAIEFGGCLSIDAKSSQSLIILIQNSEVKQIRSRFKGGFMYISSGNNDIKVHLKNITIQDSYSQQGSIIFLSFSNNEIKLGSVQFENIRIQYSKFGIIQYFDEYFMSSISTNEEQRLINNMTLLFIENAKSLFLSEIYVNSLLNQAFLIGMNLIKIKVFKLTVEESNIRHNIIALTPQLGVQNLITLNQILFQNIKSYQKPTEISLPTEIVEHKYGQAFQCPFEYEIQRGNFSLNSRNFNLNLTFGNYYCNKILLEGYFPESLISLNSLGNSTQIKITNVFFSSISCSTCEQGLLNIQFKSQTNTLVNLINFQIINSECGIFGCLNLQKDSNSEINQNRILKRENNIQFEIFVQNYICINNTNNYGVCLFIKNLATQVEKSYFSNNTAVYSGGAVFVEGHFQVAIKMSVISNNQAQVGGGIFLKEQASIDYPEFKTQISKNFALNYSNEISSIPEKLTIVYGKSDIYLTTNIIFQNNYELIDQIQAISKLKNQTNFTKKNSLILPSGQQLSQYKYFDKKSNMFNQPNRKFRIVAQNYQNELIQNLTGSFCNIKSRLVNLSEQANNISFSDNETSMNLLYFNEGTQDYNLDNLSLYFNTLLPDEMIYQLQFNCSSILVPIFTETFQILGYHQNYKLRLNIKPLPCTYGEILNLSSLSCQLCNSNLGFFSINLNQSKCQLKDDFSTMSVTSAQLNMRPYFWRPYFESSQISYCLNLPRNCLGGWSQGDNTCFPGHIGALCEECDISNLRGDGQYSLSTKYSCQPCSQNSKNIMILVIASFWTLISIIISVQDAIKIIKQQNLAISLNKLFLKYGFNGNNSSKILKIFINYFQIISSIAQELQISTGLMLSINTLGVPIRAAAYSLDCILINIVKVSIQYSRVIWHLCAPVIYVSIIQLLFIVFVQFKISVYNIEVIFTSMLYVFIYLQPSIMESLIQVLSFREISGLRWISANVSQNYDTTIHFEWMKNFVLPFAAIFGIFIPFFLFYQLYVKRLKLQEKKTRQILGFLYMEYKYESYYWEIIKIFQKELMIAILTFYDQELVLKFCITILILLIYIKLNQLFQPYHQFFFNLLDYSSSLTCIATMVLIIGVYKAEQNNVVEIKILNYLALILINSYLICQLIFLIIQRRLKENTDFILEKIIQLSYRYKVFQNVCCFKKLQKLKEKRIRIKNRFGALKQCLFQQARLIVELKQYLNDQEIENKYEMNSFYLFQKQKQNAKILSKVLNQVCFDSSKGFSVMEHCDKNKL